MDIHDYAYTIGYGYIHDSIIDIDNSITDIHNYFWISIMRVFIHVDAIIYTHIYIVSAV